MISGVLLATLLCLLLVLSKVPEAHAESSVGDSAASIAASQEGTAEVTATGCNKYTGVLYGQSARCPAGTSDKGSNAYPWCADFAKWAWLQAGADVGGLTSLANSFYSYSQRHPGTWHPVGSGYTPQPGDAVVYGLNTSTTADDHVGIALNSGSAIHGNLFDGRVWRVMRLNGFGVQTRVLSGWVTPVGGGGATTGSANPATGTVLGSSPRATHIGPSGQTGQVGTIPNGTVIKVDCTVTGQAVAGPYGTETIWDRTSYNGKVQFISDSWVYTGTNSAAFPPCGGNGVAMQPGCLSIHAAPSNASTVVGCIPQATSLQVSCTSGGDSNTGPYGATTLWDHTSYNGVAGYVTDAFVYTGKDGAIAGGCPPIAGPTISTTSLPRASVGGRYSLFLSVSGGAGPFTWSRVSGALPSGLTIDARGLISGTPTRSGTFSVGVRVTDSQSPKRSATRSLTITVSSATKRIVNSKAPSISGTPKMGKTLTASKGSWSPSGLTFTFQWYRDSSAISKATGRTYKVPSSAKGHKIRVRVKASRSGYASLIKYSSYTPKIG